MGRHKQLGEIGPERFHDAKSRAKIHQQFQAHVNLWRRPFATCVPYAREACRSGLETGEFTYAGYGAATEGWAALLVARDLDRFVRDYTPHLALLARIQMSHFRAAHQVVLNWARALQGRTAGPLSLWDATFDEREFVAKYERAAPFFLTFLYTARLHLAVMFGAFETALEAARCARAPAVVGTIWPVLIDFWEGLAMTALYDGATDRTRAEYQERLAVTLRGRVGSRTSREQSPG